MGPIERELRRGARVCDGAEPLEPYQGWPGIAAWSLDYEAVSFLSAFVTGCEMDLDAWSEAIEAAEALKL